MTLSQRAALVACVLLSGGALACELVLSEHRSARELARLPLAPALPSALIAFTHSVLGTPVSDRYVWRRHGDGWRAHLIEERFEGAGYGLPYGAGPGETLTREGDAWRLQLDRVVYPLVVLPLPSQQMRVVIGDGPAVHLGALSNRSIQMQAVNCPNH